MTYYRAFRNLSNGIARGQVFPASALHPRSIEVLAERGFIARISAPPLAELPGWKLRSKKLVPLGIVDAEQFLEAPEEQLLAALRVSPAQVAAWRREIIGWLSAPQPSAG